MFEAVIDFERVGDMVDAAVAERDVETDGTAPLEIEDDGDPEFDGVFDGEAVTDGVFVKERVAVVDEEGHVVVKELDKITAC